LNLSKFWMATVWVIWKKRNNRIFNQKIKPEDWYFGSFSR